MATDVAECFVEQVLNLLIGDLSAARPDLPRLCEHAPPESLTVGNIRRRVGTIRAYADRLIISKRSAQPPLGRRMASTRTRGQRHHIVVNAVFDKPASVRRAENLLVIRLVLRE